MNLELVHAIWTLLLLLVFLGIVAWAWSARRQRGFEQAARLPLEDDPHPHSLSRDAGEAGAPSARRPRSFTREHHDG